MTARRTVDIIADLRGWVDDGLYSRGELQILALEAADRLETFAWDGIPPRTPHLAAGSPPNAGDVDAGALPSSAHRVDAPAVAFGGDGGGEVRLAITAMPLTAAEFSEPDPAPAYGLARPMPRLWIVQP